MKGKGNGEGGSNHFHKPFEWFCSPQEFENHYGYNFINMFKTFSVSKMVFYTHIRHTFMDSKYLKHSFEGILTQTVVSEANS